MNTLSGTDHPADAGWLGRLQQASFSQAGEAMRKAYPPERRMTDAQMERYLARRTYALASTTRHVRSQPWLALSVLEGEHDTHAAILAEGPPEVLMTVPKEVRTITERRSRGTKLDWTTAWMHMTPQRLFSFAEVAWQDVAR